MYNVHQFISRKAEQDKQAIKQLKQQEYLLRHEGKDGDMFRVQKYCAWQLEEKDLRVSSKGNPVIIQELTSSKPVIIEDDHFQSWRKHRMFRDVSDENKFIGSKVFKHRPNEDMGKYYDERERREISYLASKT
jgi:hypothetical protein